MAGSLYEKPGLMRHARFNVAQAFDEMVRSFSDRPAVVFDEAHAVTYRQLDHLSNQIAGFLLAKGIRKGDRIAISMEKSLSAYALIVAALKTGAIYVALDPRNPAARREAILDQCSPCLLFSDAATDGQRIPVVPCPGNWEAPAFCESFATTSPDSSRIAGSDAAYIMFTSGSTGTPKGAVISNDNLLHFLDWARTEYAFTPEDVHTHLNPLYFDNSVFDIYSTLFTGGSLVPFDAATLQDPAALVSRVRTMKCTAWFSVPSLLIFLQVMKVATHDNLGTLRKIIFGGEGFPKPKLKHLFDELGSQTELHNVYGPTECTCICSSYQVSSEDLRDADGFPPLGQLAGHFTLHILDEATPVSPGAIGELCLGGDCVGLGYFNRPDLTAAAFVQNPTNTSFREIIYRTGDLVRLNTADGKLYFVGRRDLQIKHMGYRIELEEIQHALVAIPGVDEAAVVHRKSADLSEIIAVAATEARLTASGIRKELAKRVPAYMIPSKIHVVDRMPKNANGKTDRPALMRQYAS